MISKVLTIESEDAESRNGIRNSARLQTKTCQCQMPVTLCLLNPRRTHLLLKPSLSPGTHQKTKKSAANPNPQMISKFKRRIISQIPTSLHRKGARESLSQDLLQTERKKSLLQ
jgi:hypothetical protein